jgi:type II secretory pathway pseudopilin PulG
MKMLIYMAIAIVVMYAGLSWLLHSLEEDIERIDQAAQSADIEPDKLSFSEYDARMQLMLGYIEAMRQGVTKYRSEQGRPPDDLQALAEAKLMPRVPANPLGPGDGSVAAARDGSADWCYDAATGAVQPGDTSAGYVRQRKSLAALPAMEFNQRLAERGQTLALARQAVMAYIAENDAPPADLQALVDAKLLPSLPRNTLAYGDGSTSPLSDGSADWHYDAEMGRLDFGGVEQAMLSPRIPRTGLSMPALPMNPETIAAAQQRAGQMSAMAARQQITTMVKVYMADNGRFPRSLQELVPDYLPAIPPNPSGTGGWRYDPETGDVEPG